MPRSIEYSPGRHRLMQGAMWLIFAASLGVAAVASHARQSSLALGDRIDLQTVSVRLPAGWKFFDRSPDALFAAETAGTTYSRFLTVEEHQAGFLERMFTSGQSTPPTKRRKNSRTEQTIPMGPITGTLRVTTQAQPVAIDGDEIKLGAGRAVISAIGEFDPQHTITVSLETLSTEDDIDPDDIELVKRVAASIKPIEDDSPQLKSQ